MNEELEEARQLYRRAHQWVDDLAISGVSPRSIIIAVLAVVTDKVLISDGVEKTAALLRDQADQVERTGPGFLRSIRP